MKKSAKILVIAALVVSAVVFTACSNLMTKVSGKPEGTYVYKWEGYVCTYTFDGNSFEYSVNLDGGYKSTCSGKIKLNGYEATIKDCTYEVKNGNKLITTDRWKSFTEYTDDQELLTFEKD